MGLKFPRQKRRRLWLSLIYRIHRWVRFPARSRLAFYLNAHWIFGRFAHEESHRLFNGDTHPLRDGTQRFLACHLPTDATVLDLGCGDGVLSTWLAANSASVVGVDHDLTHLSLAKDRPARSNLEFVHGDAGEFLDRCDREFAVLVLSHVLEHLDDPEAFLSRFSARFDFVYVEVPDFEASAHNLLRENIGWNSPIRMPIISPSSGGASWRTWFGQQDSGSSRLSGFMGFNAFGVKRPTSKRLVLSLG